MRAENVYLTIRGTFAFCGYTAWVTSAIYHLDVAGLDALQLVLIGTVLELSVFVFEIPTGVVADFKSRRLSVLLGYGVIGAGFVMWSLWPSFLPILLAQVVWGAGYTLTSGAQDAWLADEVGEERMTAVLLRGTQVDQALSFAGIFASVLLATIRPDLAIRVAGLVLLALALFLWRYMPETGFRPAGEDDHRTWRKMRDTLARGITACRRSPLLRVVLLINLFAGLASEGIDRLWEMHLLTNFDLPRLTGWNNPMLLGGVHGVAMLITLIAAEGLRRRAAGLDHRGTVALLVAFQVLVIGGMLAFALAGGVALAVTAFVVVTVARRLAAPIFQGWINRGLDPRARATVLSTVNQMDAFGQVAGGPALGHLATRYGLRVAMVTVAALLAPTVGLYGVAASRPVGGATDDDRPGRRS